MSLVARAWTPASGAGPADQQHAPPWVSSCCSGLSEQTRARAGGGGVDDTGDTGGCSSVNNRKLCSCIRTQIPSCQVCLLQLPVMDADAMAGTNRSTASATSAPPRLSKAAPGCGSSSALLASVALSLSLGLCWWPPAVHTVKHGTIAGESGCKIYMTIVTAHQLPRTNDSISQRARQCSSWHQRSHLHGAPGASHGQGRCHQSLKLSKALVAMLPRKECCAGVPLPRLLACGCWARCRGSCTGMGTPARPPD